MDIKARLTLFLYADRVPYPSLREAESKLSCPRKVYEGAGWFS